LFNAAKLSQHDHDVGEDDKVADEQLGDVPNDRNLGHVRERPLWSISLTFYGQLLRQYSLNKNLPGLTVIKQKLRKTLFAQKRYSQDVDEIDHFINIL